MRLAWLSDIHLNFLDRNRLARFVVELVKTDCDAFIITGDIAESPKLIAHLLILEKSLERPIYFVLGNHDFYRSSIASVRRSMQKLVAESRFLTYLTESAVISLNERTSLIGHDGWADGRLGAYEQSDVLLNDFVLIGEFRPKRRTIEEILLPPDERLVIMHRLADQTVAHLHTVLPAALAQSEHVIFATHVPPFREACLYQGRISADDFLPFFACRVVGEYLRDAMIAHPDKRMTVLCGHTHGGGTTRILDNLTVETAGADYGAPIVQKILAVA